MSSKAFWILIIALVAIGGAWYALSANKAAAPMPHEGQAAEAPSETAPTAESGGASPTVVTLTDAGFSPSTVTIAVGDTVRFVNSSAGGMWVGSDDHPTHTAYDGTATKEHCSGGSTNNGTFDECRAAPTGESWEYTFTKAGTFGYHNHARASQSGTVVVR